MDALQITFTPPPLCDWTEALELKKIYFLLLKRSRVSLIMVRASLAASANKLFYPNHDSVERRPQLATKRRERCGAWASRKPPGAPGSLLGAGPGGVTQEQWRLINYPLQKRDALLIFNYTHNAALTWREKLAMCGGEQTVCKSLRLPECISNGLCVV